MSLLANLPKRTQIDASKFNKEPAWNSDFPTFFGPSAHVPRKKPLQSCKTFATPFQLVLAALRKQEEIPLKNPYRDKSLLDYLPKQGASSASIDSELHAIKRK